MLVLPVWMASASIPYNELPDAVLQTIQNANSIRAQRYTSLSDTTILEEEIKLNQEHRGTLKSAVLLSEIHPFNGTVFGLFLPKVCYIFKNKKDSCKLLIDFSLKQVHVEVEDSMQIYTLHDNVLLKESILLFPEDRYMPDLLRLSL